VPGVEDGSYLMRLLWILSGLAVVVLHLGFLRDLFLSLGTLGRVLQTIVAGGHICCGFLVNGFPRAKVLFQA